MSQPQLAQKAGLSQGTIGNIESGIRGYGESVLDIAKVLDVSPDYLRCRTSVYASYDGKQTQISAKLVFRGNADDAGAPRTIRPTPVVGEAKLGKGGYYEHLQYPPGDGDGWVDGYSADPDAYALRVKGDSMHPAIRHGSFVVVEPNSTCTVGEYVAIALISGEKMVKELIIERADEIVIESVNGGQRETIERELIESMHPVAAVVSASKWRPA